MTDIRSKILGTAEDLVIGFLYYDRKEDEELPRGVIENALEEGILTIDDIANAFRQELYSSLQSLTLHE